MSKITGKILQRAEMPDGSATLLVEMENGSRFEHKLEKEDARGAFAAGEDITSTFSQTAKQKMQVADNAQPMESAETLAMMNQKSVTPNDGAKIPTTGESLGGGSASADSNQPATDSNAVAGTTGGASSTTDAGSANRTSKSK